MGWKFFDSSFKCLSGGPTCYLSMSYTNYRSTAACVLCAFTCVVFFESMMYIVCTAGVKCSVFALDNVDIPHVYDSLSCFRLYLKSPEK
jgi:hypothetical protein